MFKNKRVLVRNLISTFVPFAIVIIIAVSFLNRTFRMLEVRNRSVLQTQMENVLYEIESEVNLCSYVADQICIDSALSRKNMLEYGSLTLAGMERLSLHGFRINMYPRIFLTYTPMQLAAKEGTYTWEVYSRYTLKLTEDSCARWDQLMSSQESFSSAVLEGKSGKRYLLLLYYYPESQSIEEKRIGFVFEETEMKSQLQAAMRELNGAAVLTWGDQVVTYVNELIHNVSSEEEAQFVSGITTGDITDGHEMIVCEAESCDMRLHILLDNSVLKRELVNVEIQMAVIGAAAIIVLTLFIWFWGKYRYRVLDEIKRLAVNNHPDLSVRNAADEYEIIRMVLERNIQELKTQREDIISFMDEGRKQISWLLLCSSPPENIDIAQLMDGYGIVDEGNFYCAMEFLMDDPLDEETLLFDDISEIILQCVLKHEKGYSLVLGLSLLDSDPKRSKRLEIGESVITKLLEEDQRCRMVSCGLVYDQLSQMYSSRQEAHSIILTQAALEASGKAVWFFDSMTHLPKNVSHVVDDLLKQFHDALCQKDGEQASDILQQLMRRCNQESQHIYVRYKIVNSLINVVREMDISPDQIENLMKLMYLDGEEFERRVERLIAQQFIKSTKTNVTDTQILEYIEHRFCDSQISLGSIAEHFQISERSISRIIKKAINMTYKEYLNHLRMKKACSLLMETEMDVRSVVKEVGYYDVSSFNRLFKQTFSMTPIEYRNQEKAKSAVNTDGYGDTNY